MVCLRRLVVIFAAFICYASGRAVNISNTWVLPEEGFPVFYRYFRDRISWYEADAVCQFHHGNLVTVDTTTQFDAVRAYLKELDIVNNVWIGLTRPSDKTTFSWSGETPQPLSGEGFWGEAAAVPGTAVCAAADPAADFRWHALTCGGPEVASFICELPVPQWALGTNGCMLTSLPSLTVIYLPEQTALELTSDCGLDGTKRIACKGNADQQEMMRQLSCGITHEDFDEKAASKAPMQSTTSDSHTHISSSNSLSNNIELLSSRGSATVTATATATATAVQKAATKPWIWTSNTIDTSEYGSPTRHRRETEDTYSTAGGISLSTTTETTAAPFTSNPLPETNRHRPSPKSSEVLSTRRTRPSTLEVSSTLETISSTEETSNAGEYPSINQGQLFSIIENGTMFDIIEVNDTSESDSKMEKTTIKSLTISPMTAIFDTLLTTKIPAPSIAVFGKSAKNSNKSPNDLAEGQPEKTFMKAIEMEAFPLNMNSSVDVKLNRTNRKELPLLVSPEYINSTEHTDFKQIDKDFTISTSEIYPTAKDPSNDNHQHKIVEITITDIERKTDATKLYVTTKKYDKKKEKMINNNEETMYKKQKKKNVAPTADMNIHDVSEMPVLASVENITNSEVNANTNANTTLEEDNAQIYIDSKMADLYNKNFTKVKGANLTTKLIEDNGEYDVEKNVEVKTTEEPMEAIPEAQPRPNRNRVLTRPQRRSFYPYFFSRVLG